MIARFVVRWFHFQKSIEDRQGCTLLVELAIARYQVRQVRTRIVVQEGLHFLRRVHRSDEFRLVGRCICLAVLRQREIISQRELGVGRKDVIASEKDIVVNQEMNEA